MKRLIRACKELDRKAQKEMVHHLSPFLFSICRRYAASHEDAQDLLQEVFILIFNNIEECLATEAPAFKAWCRRIAINCALAKKRKKQLMTTNKAPMDYQYAKGPAIYAKLEAEAILRLLDKIPEQYRMVFNLSIIDGYAHSEIAELLQIKESSSRTFLVRARQQMQKLITQQQQQKYTG